MNEIRQLNSTEVQKLKKELIKILSLNLDITGELAEVSLENVYPNANRLTLNTKDKRWIDVILPDRGIEIKTFQTSGKKEIETGTQVFNVLKRVSEIEYLDANGQFREATEVGKDLIDYLHSTIRMHAHQKGISGELTMGILFRTIDNSHFAYWEQELHFGEYTDYEWAWNITNTKRKGLDVTTRSLIGIQNGVVMIKWYCVNQKQVFYRYIVPAGTPTFEIRPEETQKKTFFITEEELQEKLAEAFRQGQESKDNHTDF